MGSAHPHRGDRADRSRVDVNDDEELHYWAQHFHTTEDDLRAAVSEVGTDVDAVGDFLQRGRNPPQHPRTHRPPLT